MSTQGADDSTKLEVLGKISAGVKLAELVIEYGIKYPVLLKWRKELKDAESSQEVAALIDVDAVMVHKVAEEVKQELNGLIEVDVNDITTVDESATELTKNIDGLQLLNNKVQTTALKLADRIDNLSFAATEAKDVLVLVDALTKLQVAFFNKTGTYVQVNNMGVDSPLGEFKGLLSD